MEKTITLENDPIFHHAVRLQENRDYHTGAEYRAEGAREALCDLVIHGKLDAIDLKIIAARDCYPMPSMRRVSRKLKIHPATVSRRMQHIRRLLIKAVPV